MERFAVIDTETTGFGKTDRLVEIAVVLVEGKEIVQEWETLINPERDISNSNIHGITSELVSLTPTFAEINSELSRLINGTIMVAHNISFDQRMLEQEFSRVKKDNDLGVGFCTLQATKLKLESACKEYGITNVSAHRALTDARVGTHQSKGWILLEIRGPMDGLTTQKWETGILNMLKRHGAHLSPTHIVGKFDGYSEAWMKSSMEMKSIKEMMELVRDEEMNIQSKKPKKNR